jgi:maltose O-acetyltransferase
MKRLLRHCNNCDFITGFRCYYGHIYAKNVFLGNTVFFDYAPIYIGEGTQLGYENIIITSSHDTKKWSRIIAKPVHIGKNVWVTSRCIILGGVKIGDNVIIGAGSVVTKDIPSNVFAAGNPCRVIRNIESTGNLSI